MEVAEPHLYPKPASDLAEHYPFDYIIGSVHWVGSHFMFDETYFKKSTADEVFRLYFKELKQMVMSADIDIAAHFDIPARTAKPLIDYEPELYENQIKDILHIIIDRHLVLEINPAGFRKPAGNLMPDAIILNWYFEMGGKRISLGSDAHQVEQLGLHLKKALFFTRQYWLLFFDRFY